MNQRFKLNQNVIFRGDPGDYPLVKGLKYGSTGTITLVIPKDPRPDYFVEFIAGHAGEIRELDLD